MEIKERLIAMGVPAADIDEVLADVGEVIIRRAFDEKVRKAPSEIRDVIEKLSGNHLTEYIERHREALHITEEELAPIAEKTWQEYFDAFK